MNINTATIARLENWFETFLTEKFGCEMDEIVVYDSIFATVTAADLMGEVVENAGLADVRKIANTMVKIDYVNGDVMDFLQHILKGAWQAGWLEDYGLIAA